MFQVLDNNKRADSKNFLVHESWSKSKFDSFKEAQDYANKWLGIYGPVVLELNKPYDYSGGGDMIEIREVED